MKTSFHQIAAKQARTSLSSLLALVKSLEEVSGHDLLSHLSSYFGRWVFSHCPERRCLDEQSPSPEVQSPIVDHRKWIRLSPYWRIDTRFSMDDRYRNVFSMGLELVPAIPPRHKSHARSKFRRPDIAQLSVAGGRPVGRVLTRCIRNHLWWVSEFELASPPRGKFRTCLLLPSVDLTRSDPVLILWTFFHDMLETNSIVCGPIHHLNQEMMRQKRRSTNKIESIDWATNR